MKLFPFFIDIEDKTFVVVGGGSVARGKIEKLMDFTDRIIVIAPDTGIEPVGQLRVCRRPYRSIDVEAGDFIIGATDNAALNRRIAEDAKKAGKLCNIVDAPELCTFVFPGLVHRGDLTIGISSNGKSPVATQFVRHRLEEDLPDILEVIIERMGHLRHIVPKYIADPKLRKGAYEEIFDTLMKTENRASDDVIAAIIRRHATAEKH